MSGSIYGTGHPLDLGENKDAAVLAGYAMFEPVAGSGDISLTVKTVNREAQTVKVPAPSGGFVAGSSYVVTLHFEASSIAPSISVTQWIESTEGPEVTV